MITRLEQLRKNLTDLEGFIDNEVFAKFKEAREVECSIYNQDIAYVAQSWDEVVTLRAKRQNTLEILTTFEEMRENLKAEIVKQAESDTKLASESNR